ncbi:MAG TPA: hypothetical protein VFV31_00005, partial [Chitinophagaceae bacterium]|nr:hypothetical protein [Chitinophagaceae bacterium]
TLMTLTGIALLETLFKNNLFASTIREVSSKWLKELHIMCKDLKTSKITEIQWQTKIDEFHRKLPLTDLLKLINYEDAVKAFKYPDKGVVTKDILFPKVDGISENYSFVGRIFGMQKDRAIIPHGHKNMTSCHRVLTGEVLLKQYDRIRDENDYMFIKQTIEETGKAGSFSSISDDRNNIHWLVTNTSYAHTFDVIVVGLHNKETEIDNIDIYEAQKVETDLLKVKKMYWKDALEKYGNSHH